MKAYKLTFAFLIFFGMTINFLLVPGKQEWALIHLQGRQYEEAEIFYEELLRENSTDRNNLNPLTQLYLTKGETDALIRIHENYLKKKPGDLEVWERLFKIYNDTQRPYDLINALEQVVISHPDVKYYEQLISQYEAKGITDGRLLAALDQIVKLDPGREKDRLKLALLYARSGHIVEASNIMDDYASRFPEKLNNNLAELRLRLLLSTDRMQEAFAWTEQWLSKHQNSSMRFMALLYSGGQSVNLDSALDAPGSVGPEKMPGWLISAVVKAASDNDKYDFLEKYIAHLGKNVVSNYPVVMARLALNRNDMTEVNKWLEVSENRSDLTSHQQIHLIQIYFRSHKVSKGLALLSKIVQQPEIPVTIFVEAAPYILKSENIDEGLAIFQSLREHKQQNNLINETWALFAAAAGKTPEIAEWLEHAVGRNISRRKLNDIYYAAIDRTHFDLAAVVGRQLYSQYREPDEARLLLRALLGMDRSTDVNIELTALLKERNHFLKISRKEQQELAFQLLHAGQKQAAINEFQRLAMDEGPQGKNVQQLLYLWGAMPGDKEIDWLEARAKTALSSELASWWQHLVQAGGAERVAAFSDHTNTVLSVEAEDIYLYALTIEADSATLDKQLQILAKRADNPDRLKKYAMQASYAGLSETAEAIWQRLHDLEPTNTKAIRELGITAFNRGDMYGAGKYLSQLAVLSEDDWETAYYMGEVYSAFERKSDADLYYRKSLQLIDIEPGDKKRKDLARAYLMYRLGDVKQAMSTYQRLIESYPDDLDVRATYSAILIDEGRLEIAGSLLSDQR